LDHEPAFAWWVPFTLQKRNRIIAVVNKHFLKKTHMFGIKIPHSLAECKQLDDENGDTQWMDAVKKEMDAVRVVFRVLPGNETVPPGYQEIACHLVFDAKMEDFHRKACYVAQGNRTETPGTLTYASVVSREMV
jgi:hypothetical protein